LNPDYILLSHTRRGVLFVPQLELPYYVFSAWLGFRFLSIALPSDLKNSWSKPQALCYKRLDAQLETPFRAGGGPAYALARNGGKLILTNQQSKRP
jgi:hypothetical protein